MPLFLSLSFFTFFYFTLLYKINSSPSSKFSSSNLTSTQLNSTQLITYTYLSSSLQTKISLTQTTPPALCISMMTTNTSPKNNNVGEFGDTTLTKVFVGGLAWETPKDALRDHFEKYGEILEAVIISDKLTGKSKGYGFVTFQEAEAAKKACEDSATLVINGRRANCNLAFLGARRPRSSSTASPPPHPQGGSNSGVVVKNNAAGNHVQPYYHPLRTTAMPFHNHPLPFYGYTPTYIVTDINYNYNQKLSYGNGGAYQQMSHVYPRQGIVGGNTVMPVYPLYQYHHPTETIGLPAHNFYPTAPWAPFTIISKPSSIIPHTGTVGTGECFKRVV